MPKTYKVDDVVAMLKHRQRDRSVRQLAAELEITPQYLGDVFKGFREPGEKILSKLGLERQVVYVRK